MRKRQGNPKPVSGAFLPRSGPRGGSRQVSEATRAVVLLRDDYRCVRCGLATSQIHHRKPRGMGGTRDDRINDPRNLVTLCGSGTTGCHGWVESHRDAARQYGWLIRSLDELDTPIDIGFGINLQLSSTGRRRYYRVDVDSTTPPREEEPQ